MATACIGVRGVGSAVRRNVAPPNRAVRVPPSMSISGGEPAVRTFSFPRAPAISERLDFQSRWEVGDEATTWAEAERPAEGDDALAIVSTGSLRADVVVEVVEEEGLGRVTGAALLVAGGTIGAGILALPTSTAAAGFIPSAVMLVSAWVYMCITALLIVEVASGKGGGANFMSMIGGTLGKPGMAVGAVLYVFIYLSTIVAYIAEGARAMLGATAMATGAPLAIPQWVGCAVFTATLANIIARGTSHVDLANRALSAVAAGSFFALVAAASTHVTAGALLAQSWPAALSTLPIMVVSFNFHNMVPSLYRYVGDARGTAQAIVGGSAIPLALYLMWEAVVLGAGGPQGLAALTGLVVPVFSFAAITTSFLGVALGFVDFVQDVMLTASLPVMRAPRRRWAFGLVFIPCLVVAVLTGGHPGVFHAALQFGGTLDLIMFGAIPAAMVWVSRYRQGKSAWVCGGPGLLVGVGLVAALVAVLEVGPVALGAVDNFFPWLLPAICAATPLAVC